MNLFNDSQKSSIYLELGHIYGRLEDYTKAIEKFKAAQAAYKTESAKSEEVGVCAYHIGFCMFVSRKFDISEI